MALKGYSTGALSPNDWETGSRRSGGGQDKPLPESDLDGDLIGAKKLRKVIEAVEAPKADQ